MAQWRDRELERLDSAIILEGKVFKSEKQLFKEAQKLEASINETHQLPALNGKTPDEFSAKAALRFLDSTYNWRKRNLQHVKGKVAFIRLVRKSGRVTLTADDKFFVGKKYKWQYVQAVVNVQKQQLNFYLMGKLIKSVVYP